MTHTRCRSCNAQVITVVDDMGVEVSLDPTALSLPGEALAIIVGKRRTWRLSPRNHKRLPREVWKRTTHMIGTDPRGGSLHANHLCGQPVPDAWAAPAAASPMSAPTEEIPF